MSDPKARHRRRQPDRDEPETLAHLAERDTAPPPEAASEQDRGAGIEVVARPAESVIDVTVKPADTGTTRSRLPSPGLERGAAGLPEADVDEHALLPRGAWLAMRKSGGLLFRSREIVVYPNGQVTTRAVGGGSAARSEELPRLSKAEIAALRRTVRRINFSRLPTRSAPQRSDAIAYELVVASNRTTYKIEAVTGAIPAPLAPLIDQLNRIMERAE